MTYFFECLNVRIKICLHDLLNIFTEENQEKFPKLPCFEALS